MSARSVFASRPTTLALYSLPSASFTTISSAFSTTWLLVRMKPWVSMTKPEPRLFCLNERRGSWPGPKKRSKGSPKGSPGWPCDPSPGPRRPPPSPFVVVEMFTTAGKLFRAKSTKFGSVSPVLGPPFVAAGASGPSDGSAANGGADGTKRRKPASEAPHVALARHRPYAHSIPSCGATCGPFRRNASAGRREPSRTGALRRRRRCRAFSLATC